MTCEPYNPRDMRKQQHHRVKLLEEFFEPVLQRKKLFEARQNDRDYMPGDLITLFEWRQQAGKGGSPTGREITFLIGYVLFGPPEWILYGIHTGHCVFSLLDVPKPLPVNLSGKPTLFDVITDRRSLIVVPNVYINETIWCALFDKFPRKAGDDRFLYGGKTGLLDLMERDSLKPAVLIINVRNAHGFRAELNNVIWIGDIPHTDDPKFADYEQAMSRGDRHGSMAKRHHYTEAEIKAMLK